MLSQQLGELLGLACAGSRCAYGLVLYAQSVDVPKHLHALAAAFTCISKSMLYPVLRDYREHGCHLHGSPLRKRKENYASAHRHRKREHSQFSGLCTGSEDCLVYLQVLPLTTGDLGQIT